MHLSNETSRDVGPILLWPGEHERHPRHTSSSPVTVQVNKKTEVGAAPTHLTHANFLCESTEARAVRIAGTLKKVSRIPRNHGETTEQRPGCEPTTNVSS